jgi:hypothetical protein
MFSFFSDKMERTNTLKIILPELINEDSVIAISKNLNSDQIEEINLRWFNYANLTAIPTLEKNIIGPFGDTFKKLAVEDGKLKVGLDQEELKKEKEVLKEKYSRSELFGDRKFVSDITIRPNTKYETVFSDFKQYLMIILNDNLRGRRRQDVRKFEGIPYINIDYLLETLNLSITKLTSKFNQNEIVILDKESGKKIKYDNGIKELLVYLDEDRCKNLSPKTSEDYFKARSLENNVEAFKDSFDNYIINRYGVQTSGLKENISIDNLLSDDSSVRYLFYNKESTQYAQIFSSLLNSEAKNISSSTGDFIIIDTLANYERYENKRGLIVVENNPIEKARTGKRKTMDIIRWTKAKPEIKDKRSYSLLFIDEKTFVNINSIYANLDILTREYTPSPKTLLKVSFFPGPPVY